MGAKVSKLLVVCMVAIGLMSASAHAKMYPAGGVVTGLKVSNASITIGDKVTFTVLGQGSCNVQLNGFLPNNGLNWLKFGGKLPLSHTVTAKQTGKLTVIVKPSDEPTDPMWCNGSGSVTLEVKQKPLGNVPRIQTGTPGMAENKGTQQVSIPKPTLAKLEIDAAKSIMTGNPILLSWSAWGNVLESNLPHKPDYPGCALEYEVRELLMGLNHRRQGAVKLVSTAPDGTWTLGQSHTVGQLTNIGDLTPGKYRFFVRAANTPSNTCKGEKFADFEVMAPAAGGAGDPTIKAVSIVQNNNALSPVFSVSVEGFNNKECGFRLDIIGADAAGAMKNYTYGPVSNKSNSGYWKNLTFNVPATTGISYKANAYGSGSNACKGGASASFGLAKQPALYSLTTPKQSPSGGKYMLGEPIPLTLTFANAPCAWDLGLQKLPGETNWTVGFYDPSRTTVIWDDIRNSVSLKDGSKIGPGTWSVVVRPATPPEMPKNAPACAQTPPLVRVVFEVE